ncbi:hypothetical protein GWK47_052747 [Chionoecetes opilio]|uniref:Uncharacterized protein n=1 Tax=Chionoecetes opilio TaxID=41210 RepID=A0A8J4Y1G9_CHIOP|nr:hypothetical protein GWK47_052747 [Chionoecetes opilio]
MSRATYSSIIAMVSAGMGMIKRNVAPAVLERADQGVLKWYGHIEKIYERMIKKIYGSNLVSERPSRRGIEIWDQGGIELQGAKHPGVKSTKKRTREHQRRSEILLYRAPWISKKFAQSR